MSLLLLRYLVLLFLLPKHFLCILNRYLLLELTLFLCHTALHFMFLLLALTTVFLLRRLLLALFLAQIAHFQLRTAHHPSRMRKRIRHFLGIILSGCRRTLKYRHLALCTGQRRGCTLRLLRPEQLSGNISVIIIELFFRGSP